MKPKTAAVQYDILPLIRERWSTRAFSDRPVPPTVLATLLEAARWAPSCLNAQPWRFVVAARGDGTDSFEDMVWCLNRGNQIWAGRAAALIFVIVRETFVESGEPNRYAWHDAGLASGMLLLQAAALDLQVHPMAGFDIDQARAELEIPSGYAPVTVLAVGYQGDPDQLPPELAASERAARGRKPLSERAYAGLFGEPLVVKEDPDVQAVLDFWFGELSDLGRAPDDRARRWYKNDPAFDEAIRDRFGEAHRAIVEGEREAWLLSARGRLAYVLVLDQFSRNMFRGSGEMFAHDAQALEVALGSVERGMDRQLPADMRAFFYLPLMHSEELAHQERCVELFAALMLDLPREARSRVRQNLKYAGMHRDIVARFGRFPHRNELLGRETSAEEVEFLEQPGSSF